MKNKNQVEVIILGEDKQHCVFLSKFLQKKGFNKRKIRRNFNSLYSGSGEQYVRKNLAAELKTYRNKILYPDYYMLIVVIDADTYSTNERLRHLQIELEQENEPWIKEKERVLYIIPKRNIETWIHYLKGETVNEENHYPKMHKEKDCKNAVEMLITLCHNQEIPFLDLPSLHEAFQNWKNLQKL